MTAPIPADYVPKPRRQLDGSRYAGANCGPVAASNGMAWSTGGRVHPSPADFRGEMGGVWGGPNDATNLGDLGRAWNTYRDDARAKGLRLGAFTRRLMDPWSEVIDALDAGYGVLLQYDYATINERAPALSGSPSFRGLHIAFIPPTGIRRRKGRLALLVFDGLYDGRRAGIPKGPQWVDAWVLRLAAEEKVRLALLADETFAPGKSQDERKRLARTRADGVAVFATVARSTPIAKPDPDPEPQPEPTCDQKVAAAVAAAAASYDARIEALELALGTARTALVAAGAGITDAIEDIDELLPAEPDDGTEPVSGVGAEK